MLFPKTLLAEVGVASWYSTEACKYNRDPKCPTASGRSLYELEEKGERFAAAWGVAFGTKLRVTNLENGRQTTVIVRDRGPNKRLNRIIDLSKSAFGEIAGLGTGLIKVKVEAL